MRNIWLAVLLFGCAAQPSFVQLVQTARHRWEVAVCRTPRYDSLEVVPIIAGCPGPPPFGDYWYGCYYPSTETLLISKKVPGAEGVLLQVITHEMGHSIHPGKHIEDNAGIMSPYISKSRPTITEADIDMICEEYDCPCRNPEKP